jgi:integrase
MVGHRPGPKLGHGTEDVQLANGPAYTAGRQDRWQPATGTHKPRAVEASRSFRDLSDRERAFFAREYADQWHEYAFKSKFGTPIRPRNLLRTFKILLAKVDLPDTIRIHDLRHTTASLALEAGIPLKVVSERLRHSGIGITGDLYTHVALTLQKDATRRIGDLLFSPEGTRPPDGSHDGSQPEG